MVSFSLVFLPVCAFMIAVDWVPSVSPQSTAITERGWTRGLWAVAVAHAGLGEQVAGPGWVFLQLPAQPGHVVTQVVGVVLGTWPPHFLEHQPGSDQPS